jgi:heme exporter protein C
MKDAKSLLTGALLAVVAALMFVAIWMVFVYAPEERVMGSVQKIFYFHVPSAIVTFASVFVLLVSSVTYLWTRRRLADHVAVAATETGVLFCSIVLITGPIWAKPAWGVWWTWEARLTTTLVLWLILAASLMVRGYAENRDQGARLAAVLGIVAALDVPIIYKAVDWWRGQHPVVFGPGKKEPLAPEMLRTFLFCMFVFLLLYVLLLVLRTRLASHEERVQSLTESIAGR